MEALRRHQRHATANDPHRMRCPWCRMTYSSAGRYSNHVQSRHPEHKDELYSTPIYDENQHAPIHDENHDLGSDSEEVTSPQYSDSDQEDFEETTGSINADADAEM